MQRASGMISRSTRRRSREHRTNHYENKEQESHGHGNIAPTRERSCEAGLFGLDTKEMPIPPALIADTMCRECGVKQGSGWTSCEPHMRKRWREHIVVKDKIQIPSGKSRTLCLVESLIQVFARPHKLHSGTISVDLHEAWISMHGKT